MAALDMSGWAFVLPLREEPRSVTCATAHHLTQCETHGLVSRPVAQAPMAFAGLLPTVVTWAIGRRLQDLRVSGAALHLLEWPKISCRIGYVIALCRHRCTLTMPAFACNSQPVPDILSPV